MGVNIGHTPRCVHDDVCTIQTWLVSVYADIGGLIETIAIHLCMFSIGMGNFSNQLLAKIIVHIDDGVLQTLPKKQTAFASAIGFHAAVIVQMVAG